MLQALLDEAYKINGLAQTASITTIEKDKRLVLLIRQLEIMVNYQDREPPSISSTATAKEFAEFQATYFPFSRMLIQESLGDLPEAQDGEQGKNGSGVVAPGAAVQFSRDAALREHAEPEQAVAEATSEERNAGRADPEVALEGPAKAVTTTKDRLLDLYAASDRGYMVIAAEIGCAHSTAHSYLAQARRSGDNRVAKGDLLRAEPAKEPQSRARSMPTDPQPLPEVAVEDQVVTFSDPPAGEDLIHIDQVNSTATYRDQTIVITKVERRLLLALNKQLPCDMELMMQQASVMTGSSLNRELTKLNARIATIDLEVIKDAAAMFTLRRKVAEF
jgi:hypothetical protein